MSRRTYRGFLIRWLAVLAAGLALTALVNWVVDPYALFETPRIEGINQRKPAAASRVRTAKHYQVDRVDPHALIIGNSRPELGLDPEFACWPQDERPVYNLAMPGRTFYLQVRAAQHALAGHAIRRLVVGLDLLDFLIPPDEDYPGPFGRRRAAEDERRLRVTAAGEPNPYYPLQRLIDYNAALLSLQALADSLITLASQGDRYASTRTRLGFNPARDYLGAARREGLHDLFQAKRRELAGRLGAGGWRLYQPGASGSGEAPDSSRFEALRQLLELAAAEGAEMTLFINPYHADYLDLIQAAGLWPLFEDWKRRLTAIAADYGVPLWDFSGYHRYAIEPAPGAGRRGPVLEWFWEPAHYRRGLGDRMLARMLPDCPLADRAADLGLRLTPADLAATLRRQRAARDAFAEAHPDRIGRARALIERSR